MPKEKKRAKVASRNRVSERPSSAQALVMLTGAGCRVSRAAAMKADCGRPRVGWRYGSDSDISCSDCLRAIE